MSKEKDNRLALLGIVVLVVTAFGCLSKYGKLDDLGRFVGNLFGQ